MGLFLRPRRRMLRLATGMTGGIVAYEVDKQRSERDAQDQQAAAAGQAAPAPAPAFDAAADLERLAQLHQAGALTDPEFTAAKAQLLGL